MTEDTRQIEIRLARSAEHVRYEKGNRVREVGPDMSWIVAALQPKIERALQTQYGPQTEGMLSVARVDMRINGLFSENSPIIRAFVGEVPSDTFEGLDLGGA